MLKKLAEDFHNKLYHTPANSHDLEAFARLVLNKFIEELEENQMGVGWNYGFDSVIFTNKNVDDNKSLQVIKERYLGNKDNKGDTIKP